MYYIACKIKCLVNMHKIRKLFLLIRFLDAEIRECYNKGNLKDKNSFLKEKHERENIRGNNKGIQ